MTETILNNCRFCLKMIYDNKFDIIGEVTNQILNALFLKINLDRDMECVMCIECATKLQNAVDFKTNCLTLESKMSPSIDFENSVKLASNGENSKRNTCLTSTDISKNQLCQFCRRSTKSESCIYLQDRKESVFMVDILQKHVPELHLNITGEIVTCETCHYSLQSFLNFIAVCSETEVKVKKMDRKTIYDQFKLNISKDIPLKYENVADAGETYNYSVEYINVKNEMACQVENMEVDSLSVNIKSEEMEIKLEQGNDESAIYNCEEKYPHPETIKDEHERHTLNQSRKIYSCEWCTFQTERKHCLKIHWSTQQHHPKVTLYSCDSCAFKTKSKCMLKDHMVFHQSPVEIETFSCELCSFKATIKESLRSHSLTHQDFLDPTLFTCNQCSYKTKRKYNLQKHQVTHQNRSGPTIHKCDICPYESKKKFNLKVHVLIHQSSSEISMYSCEFCSYITKRKQNLKNHQVKWHPLNSYTPANQSFCTTYKCETCSYASKEKSGLKRHMLTHQSPSEVNMYRCGSCSLETKYKQNFQRHQLKMHAQLPQTASEELKIFKCANCAYSSKKKGTLKTHMLIHRNLSEAEMYKCELCSYASNQKSNLKRHWLVHQDSSEVNMYSCESCSFETKRKGDLKKHQLSKHKTQQV